MIIDQFTIDQLFHRIDTMDGELLYWARTKHEDGYIVVWPDTRTIDTADGMAAEHLHTYRYPPDVWG
jgi:hypothetical protein